MPLLIEHIDAIARKKQRDVLFICFDPDTAASCRLSEETNEDAGSDADEMDYYDNRLNSHYNYQDDHNRKEVLAWLDQQQIKWELCGPVADPCHMESYNGRVYVDIPFDENDERFCRLRDYLENPDGTMRDPQVTFCGLTLSVAMENAHHDEPGFWERWAENF